MAPGVRVRKAGAGGPETHSSITDGKRREGLPGQEGEVEFRDVTFRYPDASDNILEHVSFRARKGQTVAFIGATGSGKTSLVNLIPRFYDVTGGQVLVDGADVRDYALDALHEKLGYVPQKAVMFSGTVSSNVTYGAEHATQEQVQQAVAIAQATDFVDTIGYDGAVAQGGANLSGGQKAAAGHRPGRVPETGNLYFRRQLLRSGLSDRPGPAPDPEAGNRRHHQSHCSPANRHHPGCGSHFSAGRRKSRGQGTHPELLKSCEVYRQIALSQLSKEELEHA